MSDLQKTSMKSFWQRPEGKTGAIVATGAVVGGGVLLYKALPYIIVMLQNTIYACLLAFGALILTSPLWSEKVRLLIRYFFMSAMRKLTGLFVEIDPIGILKNYVEDLRKSLGKMNENIASLRGHITKLKGNISKNEEEAEKCLKLSKAAQDKKNLSALRVNARQHERLLASNRNLNALLTKLEATYAVLCKLREASDMMVQDMENEIVVKEAEYRSMAAGHSAFKSAMKIMRGEDAARGLYDQAMDHLADDYAQKVGEIEDFLETSKGFLATVDLENQIDEMAVMEKLNQMEAQAHKLMLPAPKKDDAFPTLTVERREPVLVERRQSSDVQDLFKIDSK